MITLLELEWDKCFSYGMGNKISLNNNILTQLVGTNGAGKSSIPAIIEEALYNKNSKGCKRSGVPNRNFDGTYNISLSFQKDDDLYKIIIKRASTTRVKLLKNGEDISSHTATNTFKQIEDIIGRDFKTFSQIIYQNAKTGLQFLTSTDTSRKKFLVDLLGLEKYVEYHEQFKGISRDVSNKILSLRSKIEAFSTWIDDAYKSNLDILSPIPEDTSVDISKEIAERAALESKLDNIASTNRAIAKNNNFKAQISRFKPNPELATKTEEDTHKLSSSIGVITSEIDSAKKMIKKVAALDAKCPTCMQEISEDFKQHIVNTNTKTVEKLSADLAKLNSNLAKIKASNKLITEYKKSEAEFENLYRSIDSSLPATLLDADDLQTRVNELTEIITSNKKKIEAVRKENERIAKHNAKVSVIMEQIDSTKDKLEQLELEVSPLEDIASNVDIIKKAFSTNGLLAYKIENLVKELESIVNDYLVEMSEGRFTLTFSINNDKLDIGIEDDGDSTDIEALSSGELARVNTSMLLAIRKLMSSISKSQINVLFLDEVIAVLDMDGREKLVDLLIKEENLNTFIVSHEWTHPLLSKLVISKNQGISRIDDGGF